MYIDHIEGRYTNNRNKINKKGANSMKVFASFASFDYPKLEREKERDRLYLPEQVFSLEWRRIYWKNEKEANYTNIY